jgi:uncharacterized membrane protein YgaE (UPF0421/DUF939 family)
MKLGARIVKTGIAIALAIYLAAILGLPSPAFAGIAAVFAIQPSIYRTYQTILEQVQANFIGAFVAIVFVLIFDNDPFVIGLVSIIVILICLKLKIEATIALALVTVIAIMETPDENFIYFALMRFSAVLLGVFSSFMINLIFIPPKYETKLYYKIVDNTRDIIQWIRVITSSVSEHTVLKKELDKIKDAMIKTDHLYLLFKEERNYFRKKQYVKGRKLVLFRQMIVTAYSSLNTLKKLYRFENEFNHLPDSFQTQYKEIVEETLTYHEQLLFKYIGKIRPGISYELIHQLNEMKKGLKDCFLKTYSKHQEDEAQHTIDHILVLITTIIDYTEQLEHLDKLIDSFQTYHKEDNEVGIMSN